MNWNTVPTIRWNGIPRGYKIFVIKQEDFNNVLVDNNNATITSDVNSVVTTTYDIFHLEKYKEYKIWMTAYTIKGDGVNGTAVNAWTDEDCELIFLF